MNVPLVVHLQTASSDPVCTAAAAMVEKTLLEEGFVVTVDANEPHDADLIVRAEIAPRAGGHEIVALLGATKTRDMLPLLADAGDPTAPDLDAISDATERWQRRFARWPQLDRHFNPTPRETPSCDVRSSSR